VTREPPPCNREPDIEDYIDVAATIIAAKSIFGARYVGQFIDRSEQPTGVLILSVVSGDVATDDERLAQTLDHSPYVCVRTVRFTEAELLKELARIADLLQESRIIGAAASMDTRRNRVVAYVPSSADKLLRDVADHFTLPGITVIEPGIKAPSPSA
jgi:hypothetical protein